MAMKSEEVPGASEEKRISAELDAMIRLHKLSTLSVTEGDLRQSFARLSIQQLLSQALTSATFNSSIRFQWHLGSLPSADFSSLGSISGTTCLKVRAPAAYRSNRENASSSKMWNKPQF